MSNKTFLHDDLLLKDVSWASKDLQLYDNQSGFEVSNSKNKDLVQQCGFQKVWKILLLQNKDTKGKHVKQNLPLW